MALLFIDLDRFKEVNDLLGHDAGDMLLVEAARRIERCLRPGDTVARLGGDEFTVILTEMRELAHIEQTAQGILDALRQPFQLGDRAGATCRAASASPLYPGDGRRRPEELMRNADHAMYRSKAAGRNQLTFFEAGDAGGGDAPPQADQRAAPRAAGAPAGAVLPADHRRSPPAASSRPRRCCAGAGPDGGLALPAEFVGIAEETGLIHEIGNWVFSEAAHWSQRWSGMLGRAVPDQHQQVAGAVPARMPTPDGLGRLPAASWACRATASRSRSPKACC